LRTVLASFGTSVSEAELVQASQMDEGGLEIRVFADLARQYGLRADVVQLSLEGYPALHAAAAAMAW
jgi:hypothetical protein